MSPFSVTKRTIDSVDLTSHATPMAMRQSISLTDLPAELLKIMVGPIYSGGWSLRIVHSRVDGKNKLTTKSDPPMSSLLLTCRTMKEIALPLALSSFNGIVQLESAADLTLIPRARFFQANVQQVMIESNRRIDGLEGTCLDIRQCPKLEKILITSTDLSEHTFCGCDYYTELFNGRFDDELEDLAWESATSCLDGIYPALAWFDSEAMPTSDFCIEVRFCNVIYPDHSTNYQALLFTNVRWKPTGDHQQSYKVVGRAMCDGTMVRNWEEGLGTRDTWQHPFSDDTVPDPAAAFSPGMKWIPEKMPWACVLNEETIDDWERATDEQRDSSEWRRGTQYSAGQGRDDSDSDSDRDSDSE